MERRNFIALLLGTPIALAACGSDSESAPAEPPPTATETTEPETTEPETTGSTVASTGDDPGVVFEYTQAGGFTTREFAFKNPPILLVTDDGRAVVPAVTTMEFPGRLVSPQQVRTITPDGVEALLGAAEQAGLFAEISYENDPLIADAATTRVVIDVDGTTYEHAADALGLGRGPDGGDESSPERQALLDFVNSLGDLAAVVGAENLGPEEQYEPDTYQLVAIPDPSLDGYDVEPTIEAWPEGTGVTLADASACTEVAAEAIGDTFVDATELTFFTEGGTTYQVIPRPALPGRTC